MSSPARPIDQTVIHAALENGVPICIRAIRPNDEARMRGGVEQLSLESRYMRFFTSAPTLPDRVIARLVAVDGHRHLGWGALLSDDPDHPAIGAVHAIRSDTSTDQAELAIGIIDSFHGQGLARMLIAVLLVHCQTEGIVTLTAQTLADNRPAIRLLRSLGAERTGTEDGVSEFIFDVSGALRSLQDSPEPAGLKTVFEALQPYL